MSRLVSALRSPVVRWGFLLVALGLGVYAVVSNGQEIAAALGRLSAATVVLSLAASAGYVWLTLLAWRRILSDLGSPTTLVAATELFGVSQLGKYIPGGVWNIVAAAEIGTAHRIPRRHSVAAMTISVLVSLVSGLAIGSTVFFASRAPELRSWAWVGIVAVPAAIALLPPVLNALVSLALRLTRREPLARPLSVRGVLASVAWSLAAWLVAGVQVWLLVTDLGPEPTALLLWQSTAGYALSWAVGFLVVVAPAGVGIREAVLTAALAGAASVSAVFAVVLVSRALFTAVDIVLAGVGLAAGRRLRRTPERKPS